MNNLEWNVPYYLKEDSIVPGNAYVQTYKIHVPIAWLINDQRIAIWYANDGTQRGIKMINPYSKVRRDGTFWVLNCIAQFIDKRSIHKVYLDRILTPV